MINTEQLIQQLWQEIDDNYRARRIKSYNANTLFYHRGVYSHATSLWSHNPFITRYQPGRFNITAHPNEAVQLVVLSENSFSSIITHFKEAPKDDFLALTRFCLHINPTACTLPLDGIAAAPLEDKDQYQYIVFFDPLNTLLLYDIEEAE